MSRRYALLLAAALIFFGTAMMASHWAGLMFGLGVRWRNPSVPSGPYNWWSGAGPVIVGALLQFMGAVALMWWHNTCHNPACMRYGRYPAAGGTFKYCQWHHPDAHPETGFKDPEHRHSLHRSHRQGA